MTSIGLPLKGRSHTASPAIRMEVGVPAGVGKLPLQVGSGTLRGVPQGAHLLGMPLANCRADAGQK